LREFAELGMAWARHGMYELILRVSMVVVVVVLGLVLVPAEVVLFEEYADEEVRLFICIESKE
jgi:hypothetical protein